MWSGARRIGLVASFLAGCAAAADPPQRDFAGTDDPSTGVDDGTGDGGAGSNGDGSGNGNGSGNGGDGNGGDGSGGDGSGGDGSGGDGSGGDGNVDAGTGGSGGNPADTCGNGSEALTSGLSIREISLYQVVKIPLVQNGQWVSSRAVPVVQNKKALVRVFVDPLSSWSPHAVLGVLTLDNGSPKRITAELSPSGSSTDSGSSTTFNFDVDAADIGPSTQMSVALVEKSCPAQLGSASQARFPASGLQALNAEKVGKLRVVVVPVNLNGKLPDTSAAQLERVRQAMLAYYPVPDVEVTARAQQLNWPYGVDANGNGWSDLLNGVIEERSNDRAPDDVYYYGMIAPASSFMSFCGFGCVLGLAPQNSYGSPDQQAGLGIGFGNEDETLTTIVHELGHAHGRGHAPCGGAQGVDGMFPQKDGTTGSWGWDSRVDELMPPTDKDIMGYCQPVWISEYTYGALAKRSEEVNQALRFTPASGPEWHNLVVYGDGSTRWSTLRTRRLPAGEQQSATVLDAAGNVLTTTQVVHLTLSDSADSLLYLPKPGADWAKLVLEDRVIDLASARAPLSR